MKNFEQLLQEELDNLPYEKHVDDGQYNDGKHAGFELGARWALNELYTKEQVLKLMFEAYLAGYKQADIVEAGLEPLDVETSCRWILNKKFKNGKNN